jgi:putative sigma-54 modulation protein
MKIFDINNIQLKIQSPGMSVSASLEGLLTRHIEKLGKTYPRIKKCEMLLRELKKKHDRNCMIEAKLFVPGNVLFAKDEEESFELAAKNMFEDLHDQLQRFKEKLQEKNSDVKRELSIKKI